MYKKPPMMLAATLAAGAMALALNPNVEELKTIREFSSAPYDLGIFPRQPRRTPKMSGRPPIGWRNAQRKHAYAKLSKRQQANRKN